MTHFFTELYLHDRSRFVFSVGFVEIYLTGCLNLNYIVRMTSRRAILGNITPNVALHSLHVHVIAPKVF